MNFRFSVRVIFKDEVLQQHLQIFVPRGIIPPRDYQLSRKSKPVFGMSSFITGVLTIESEFFNPRRGASNFGATGGTT